MSVAGDPSGGGPMDGPPDLFAGDPGWETPLRDLTAGAGGDDGRRSAGGAPPEHGTGRVAGGDPAGEAPLVDLTAAAADAARVDTAPAADGSPRLGEPVCDALPDLGGDGTDDLWAPAPVPPPVAEDDAEAGASLDDLTRRPRGGRRSAAGRRSTRGSAGRRPAGGGAREEGPVGAPGGPRDPRPNGTGPVAEALAAAREVEASSAGAPATGDRADAPTGSTTGDRPDEPRGLATGGPIGGLEPGTLFGTVDGDRPGPDGRRRGRRRRGRRGKGEDASADDAGTGEPERPLTAEERLQHALKLSYQHLTKRDRTVSEVRAHLEKRDVDAASIAGALAELVEFGYLDDERYAARFVEDKRRLEGWGHLRIAQGLRRTGIDREIADRAVADDPLKGDEATLAVDALEQRLAGRPPEDDRARQKALRMLATKGYPLETAYAAVRAYERRCAEAAAD